MGAANGTPVDLAAVAADDALVDMLAHGEFDDLLGRAGVVYDPLRVTMPEFEIALARVLVAWRRDVDTEPIPELISRRRSALARIRAAVRGFFGGLR